MREIYVVYGSGACLVRKGGLCSMCVLHLKSNIVAQKCNDLSELRSGYIQIDLIFFAVKRPVLYTHQIRDHLLYQLKLHQCPACFGCFLAAVIG